MASLAAVLACPSCARAASPVSKGAVPVATTASLAMPARPSIGVWKVTAGTPKHPAVATAMFATEAGKSGTPTVSCIRIDPRLVRLRLLTGTEQPDTSHPTTGAVPTADRKSLLAAFNAGFKMSDSRGGWFSNGHQAAPLRLGAASLVLRSDGTADVGVWGRDVSMTRAVTAVRQNLQLLIDDGVPTALVATTKVEQVWGYTVRHRVAVWRSGIGITKEGRLVYAAGKALTVQQLTNALLAAGAMRAMELDINTQFVDAYLYRPSAAGPVGTKLAASMRYGPEHYLTPQARDFVEVLARRR
jgi:hypothetical protein